MGRIFSALFIVMSLLKRLLLSTGFSKNRHKSRTMCTKKDLKKIHRNFCLIYCIICKYMV